MYDNWSVIELHKMWVEWNFLSKATWTRYPIFSTRSRITHESERILRPIHNRNQTKTLDQKGGFYDHFDSDRGEGAMVAVSVTFLVETGLRVGTLDMYPQAGEVRWNISNLLCNLTSSLSVRAAKGNRWNIAWMKASTESSGFGLWGLGGTV